MDINNIIDVTAVHMLKGKEGDTVQLPVGMYLDCRMNIALQVHELYDHMRIEIHQ